MYSKAKPSPPMQFMLETPFVSGQHLLSSAPDGALIVLTVQTAIVVHALPKVGLTKKISTVYIINDIFAVDITFTGHLVQVPKGDLTKN